MRPKLLFLSQCLPYPPHTGVTNRTYHILGGLAASFDITLLAFTRKNHQATRQEARAACNALENLGVHINGPFGILSERSFTNKLAVHGLSVLSGKPYTYFDYGDRDFRCALQRALHEHRPDLVHVDSLDLHRWIPLLEDLPTACTHHSIESDLLRRLSEHERVAPFRAYLNRQADAIEAVERATCPRLSLNVMVSEVDAARLRRIAPSSRTFVAPNGVDVHKMTPLPHRSGVNERIAFLGPSYVLANRDGVQFFLREVWRLVREARPDATFQIIGKVADSHRAEFESFPGVTCTGFVPDFRPLIAQAACCVVPLRIGGGTRLKILDAWAMARPVISTSIGCEGLQTEDGGNILIRDTPAALAEGITRVLSDEQLASTIGAAGRRTAENLYSWDAICSSLASTYLGMISRSTERQDPFRGAS